MAVSPFAQPKIPSLATGLAAQTPQKTIKPVPQPGQVPQTPGMDLGSLVKQNVVGRDVYNPLFKTIGVSDWQQTPGGLDENGNPITWDRPNEAAAKAAEGYNFNWQDTGTGNTGTLTAYNPTGTEVGQFQQKDTNFGQDLLEWGALAAAGFGGAGLLGLGPLSGLAGGAGAGATGVSSGNAGLTGGLGTVGAETGTLAALGGEATAFGGLGELGALAAGAPAQTAFGSFALPGAGAALAAGPGGLAGVPGFEAAPLPGNEGFSFANTAATQPAADPFVFNAAADSQAFNQAAGITGSQAASAATIPSTVNLGSLGGTMGTAGGLTGALQSFMADPVNGLKAAGTSVLDFAKENPRLAAMGLGAAAQLAGGTPSLPSAGGGSGSGGTGGTNQQLIDALTQQLYGQGGSLSGMPDYSGIPGLKTDAGDLNTLNQQAIDAAYSQQTRLLDPQFARDQQAMEARLAEQGFVPGTPGYDRAMTLFNESRNQAYGGARDSSILQGYQIGQGDARNALSEAELNNSASREALSQLLAKRNQPLNELASLRSGQQIDYNNQLDRYNAEVSSSNSRNQALSQLAMALGMYLG